jgi:cysteine desulfurase
MLAWRRNEMNQSAIYCDYNAGAPIRAEAAVAMSRAMAVGGNPSSVHGAGRRARKLIEDAREIVALALDARAENLVFTSGATEALQLALTCADAASLLVSAVEHDAVFEHASRALKAECIIPVGGDGLIDLAALGEMLASAPKPALVAVQLANNETGIIQLIAGVARLCREHGAMLLVDAAQAFGRIAVSLADLDATYLVVSSHKIGGPPGVGALALAPGAPFVTTRFGGGQERGRRPGTENMPAVAGFGAAAEWALREMEGEARRVAALRDRFEANLPDDAVVFGVSYGPPASRRPTLPAGTPAVHRLPNTSNFAIPGIVAETAVIAMDLEGVAISSGAACSSGKVKSSRVLAAMGIAPALARSALRVSFGHESKASDVDAALAALNTIAARRRVLEGVGA